MHLFDVLSSAYSTLPGKNNPFENHGSSGYPNYLDTATSELTVGYLPLDLPLVRTILKINKSEWHIHLTSGRT